MTPQTDAHQHFWRLARGDYGWLTPALGPIYRDFAPEHLAPLLADAGIVRTVLVQAAPSEAETTFLLGLAREWPAAAGVVGWLEFAAPDAPRRIAALAREPALLGLRPMIQDIADADWMLSPPVRRALEALSGTRLAFDALVKPGHLPNLLRLLERLPALRVVIDHGAKPDIAHWRPGDGDFRAWAAHLRRAAALGAWCKLSGLVTEAGPGWSVETLRPYVAALLESFGPARLMWGSDWPVVNLAGGYGPWRAAACALLADLPADEQARVLGGSAAEFYRLRPA